ncbi:MAG TPA: Holliday junction branch migration protein RuvA [Candidatus Paceibacterota bacterium]|nr:Holliday junction branch migration protein RuvA [Candidatus Paceibacterota bacterium]
MIGSIKGKIILKKDKFILVDVAGVGYKAFVSPSDATFMKKMGDEVFLWTYLHVREDALDLFGFSEYAELEFFQMLLNVSGIGPKSALTILSIATVNTLKKAIGSGDISYLTKISGIGKKTAEKIVIELRDKLEDSGTDSNLQGELDALEALKSLGYSQAEAREALKKAPTDADTNTKVREALKILGNK